MMFKKKDPKAIAIEILGKKEPSTGQDKEMDTEDDSEDQDPEETDYGSAGLDKAAQDAFDALKSDNVDEFKSALLDLVKECMEQK